MNLKLSSLRLQGQNVKWPFISSIIYEPNLKNNQNLYFILLNNIKSQDPPVNRILAQQRVQCENTKNKKQPNLHNTYQKLVLALINV